MVFNHGKTEAAVQLAVPGPWPAARVEELTGDRQPPASVSAGVVSVAVGPQQVRVFRRMADGRLNKQIAADLDITEATVKAHVTAIFRKLGVRTRTQAALLLQQMESIPA